MGFALAVARYSAMPDPAGTPMNPRSGLRLAENIAAMKARPSDPVSRTETDAFREMLLAKKAQLLLDSSAESARLVGRGPIANDDQPAFLHDSLYRCRNRASIIRRCNRLMPPSNGLLRGTWAAVSPAAKLSLAGGQTQFRGQGTAYVARKTRCGTRRKRAEGPLT